jgi:hypothetical protein
MQSSAEHKAVERTRKKLVLFPSRSPRAFGVSRVKNLLTRGGRKA